jgi:hypothetical protein
VKNASMASGSGPRVDRIRFVSPDLAEVLFTILLGGAMQGPVFNGAAIRRDGRWLVSRATVMTLIAPHVGGVA